MIQGTVLDLWKMAWSYPPDAPDDPEGEDDETKNEPRQGEEAKAHAGAHLKVWVFAQLGDLQKHITNVVQ